MLLLFSKVKASHLCNLRAQTFWKRESAWLSLMIESLYDSLCYFKDICSYV